VSNMFALLVQQRPMTEAEIADERKAAEMPPGPPSLSRYMPGGPQGPLRSRHAAWNDKALKAVNAWGKRAARRVQARKKLPDLAKAENIEAYIRARKRVYSNG
jgi:hypothetical protein